MKTEYLGYTIEQETEPWSVLAGQKVFYYPTKEGVQHDGDYDDGRWKYKGNCRWASSIEDAKTEIDEITSMMNEEYQNYLNNNP